MTEKQLWNSILQMAVTGKLVPQHPEDEPASVLLARIEKEKAALIKEKKLKKEKNPTRIVRGADGRFYEISGKTYETYTKEILNQVQDDGILSPHSGISLSRHPGLRPGISLDHDAQSLSAHISKEILNQVQDDDILFPHSELSSSRHSGCSEMGNGKWEMDGSVDISDQIPFEIPESWEWVRLGTIFEIGPRNNIPDDTETGFIPMPLLKEGYTNEHSFDLKKWKDIKKGYTHFANGDIVVAKITPCFQNRKSAIMKNLPNGYGAGTTELHVLRDNTHILNMEYFLCICKTQKFIQDGIRNFTGTAGQQRVGKDFISSYLVPLPPLAEQKRIVEKLGEIAPLVSLYGEKERAVSEMDANFAGALKKSVLAAAVSGKLLPQDAADEPAAALLARIEAEKAALIKAKKLKKEKNPTRIVRAADGRFYEIPLSCHPGLRPGISLDHDAQNLSAHISKEILNQVQDDDTTGAIDISDQLPFDIPESWEWVRLETITYPVGSKNNQILAKEVKPEGSIPVVSQGSNLIDGYTDKSDKVIKDLPLIMFGDHTKNVKYIDFEFVIGADGTKFHKVLGCDVKYIYYWMIYAASKLRDRGYARHYTLLKESFIPIPPLAEQERIAARIREIFATLDELH